MSSRFGSVVVLKGPESHRGRSTRTRLRAISAAFDFTFGPSNPSAYFAPSNGGGRCLNSPAALHQNIGTVVER